MQFRIEVPVKDSFPKIDYGSKLLLTGSCFVENIGEKLDYYKLQNLRNPFGILYHPGALANFFEGVAENRVYSEREIFCYNERWHCFEAHSVLSSGTQDEIIFNLNQNLQATRAWLQKASHVIITLGTAWAYRDTGRGKLVANCHKLPQKNFSKELSEAENVRKDLGRMVAAVHKLNPALDLIFTVSPVRHIKDGVVGNQQSKAHLITGLHSLLNDPDKNRKLHYFPSYEIMMDELRDYRFYAEDMLHPNPVAVDYIWERFTNAWFSPEAVKLSGRIGNIQKGLAHKAFDEYSEAHQLFLKNLLNKIKELKREIPHLEF